jgi:hypothetical protein
MADAEHITYATAKIFLDAGWYSLAELDLLVQMWKSRNIKLTEAMTEVKISKQILPIKETS